MKTVSFNFEEVEIKDLEGVGYKIKNFANKLANRIFTRASTIPLSDKARELFRGEPVELNIDEMEEVYFITTDEPKEYKPWIDEQLVSYLDGKAFEFPELKLKIEQINKLKTQENV